MRSPAGRSPLEARWSRDAQSGASSQGIRAVRPDGPCTRFPTVHRGHADSIRFVRYGIPAVILLAGLVLIVIGGDAGTGAGIVLIGVAALVFLANVFVRLALQSEGEREDEQRAREYFSRHGRWPRQDDGAS